MILFFVMLLPPSISSFFFFNDTATTEIYTLSLHDALPISVPGGDRAGTPGGAPHLSDHGRRPDRPAARQRSEEHTSELQSRPHLVCRLLLEKKKNKKGGACSLGLPRLSRPAPAHRRSAM